MSTTLSKEKEEYKYKWEHSFIVACYAIPCILLSGVLVSPGVLAAIAFGYVLCFITSKIQNIHITSSIVIVTFGIAEMIILYEVIPLIWSNIFNGAIVFLLHGFLGQTGMWFIIEFGVPFVQFQIIEVFMFSTYPATCSLIYTWFLSSVTDIHYTPYFLLFINFVIFQLCAKPRPASLLTKDKPQPILDANMVGCIMVGHCFFPMFLFGIKTLILSPYSLVTFQFMLEAYFIFAMSGFLSTLLPIRSFIEAMNIPRSRIITLRWISGSSCLMLLLLVLKQYGFETEMMATLKWKLILFILLVALVPNKKRKNISGLLSILLVLVYLWQIHDLPWSLSLPGMESFRRFIFMSVVQFLYLMLGLNLILSVVTTWTYIYSNKKIFSLTFSFFSCVFLMMEWLMYSLYIAPRYGLILSSALYIYTIYVLSRNERLTHLPCMLCLSLVSSKLIFLTCHWIEGHRLFYGVSTFLLIIPAISALFHLLLTQQVANLFTNYSKIPLLSAMVIIPIVLLHQPLFAPFVADIFMLELCRMHLLGLSLILVGLCLSRASPLVSLPVRQRIFGPSVTVYGFFIITMRLYTSTIWCICLSLFLLGIISGAVILAQQSAGLYQKQRAIIATIVSILFGMIITFSINLFWHASPPALLLNILMNACSGLLPLLCFYFPAMLQYRYLPILYYFGLFIGIIEIMISILLPANQMSALTAAGMFCINTSLSLKMSEERRKNDEVFVNFSSDSSFAWISNSSIILFCFIGLLFFNMDFSNPLLPFLSLTLFLLQRSKPVLDRLNSSNQQIPPLFALSLFLTIGVISQSPGLFPPDNSLRYWNFYLRLRGWVELLGCLLLLPIHWMYLTFHWNVTPANQNNGVASDFPSSGRAVSVHRAYPYLYYFVTLFLIPVCMVFIVGTSYTSYLYGLYSALMAVSILLNK